MSDDPPASAEFERLHEMAMGPRPAERDARAEWLTALNRGCVLAVEHGARVDRLAHAHRAVEFGWERPVLFHNAACVFCALDMPDAAIDALRRAVRFAYHGVATLTDDRDLALIAGREEFRALVDPASGRAAEIQRRAAEHPAQPGRAEADRALEDLVEWQPSRRQTESHVVMRPGVAFTLYADAPWPDVAPRIADALEAFLALVGRDALTSG